jgi:hypothetical protein
MNKSQIPVLVNKGRDSVRIDEHAAPLPTFGLVTLKCKLFTYATFSVKYVTQF